MDVTGPFKAVSAGDVHTCAINGDDDLLCWGDDVNGGDIAFGGVAKRTGPFKAVSVGDIHTVAIRAAQMDTEEPATTEVKPTTEVKGKLITDSDGKQYELFISPYDPNVRVVIPVPE